LGAAFFTGVTTASGAAAAALVGSAVAARVGVSASFVEGAVFA
jgi:hypothetical protein